MSGKEIRAVRIDRESAADRATGSGPPVPVSLGPTISSGSSWGASGCASDAPSGRAPSEPEPSVNRDSGRSAFTVQHSRWCELLPALTVFIGALLPFLPALHNGFLGWDDEYWLVQNPWHRTPLVTRLARSWSTSFIHAYMPVTLITFVLDRALWGLQPKGYHLTNLLLHGATAVAVYALARQLIGIVLVLEGQLRERTTKVGATTAALAFAIHPLRAEPVSWVSARDTILGGLLLVLATVAYLEAWKHGPGAVRSSWFWTSVLLFAGSLLARATGLVLPVLFVLLDIYPLRRLGGMVGWISPAARRVWLEKVPFGALAMAVVPIALWPRRGALVPTLGKGWSYLHAGAIAIYTTGWSVAAVIAPVDLAPLYDMPTRTRPAGYMAAALGVLLLSAVCIAVRNRWPSALAAWTAFAVLLLPVPGAIFGGVILTPQDRYTYLPGVVVGLLAGGGAALGWSRFVTGELSFRRFVIAALAVLAMFGTWGVLTWRQCSIWRDGTVLWRHAVHVVPRNVFPCDVCAGVLEGEGDRESALEQHGEVAPLV